MSVASFNKLVELLTPRLLRRELPDRISPEERVAVTLHCFSQGSSMTTIAWKYHMGQSTVSRVVRETTEAIWEVLSPMYLKPPTVQEDWLAIADGFERQWNFPNCIGTLDGKHITIQAPKQSGSQFFNYKKTFSIVLLTCCDANYNFTLIDVGAYGCESDSGVFSNSEFGKMLDKKRMSIPAPRCLPNSNIVHPVTLVADEAFPLKSYIMRPYPGRNLEPSKRIFNYRPCRAHRVIENTFGILVSRWRMLRNAIIADLASIDSFIKAIVCLHNFANIESKLQEYRRDAVNYCPPGILDQGEQQGRWREGTDPLESVGRVSANRASQMLYGVRDRLNEYFVTDAGAVAWQNHVLNE
nr:unnamed protein product [Callosobruchus analis]